MTVKISRGLSGWLLFLILMACTNPVSMTGRQAEASRDAFVSAMRWQNYQAAAGLMVPEVRAGFLETMTALQGLKIFDVRIVDLKPHQETQTLDVWLEMDYYLLPSVKVKTFRFAQTWQYFAGKDPARQGFLIVTPLPGFP